jgi:hypothetical protein
MPPARLERAPRKDETMKSGQRVMLAATMWLGFVASGCGSSGSGNTSGGCTGATVPAPQTSIPAGQMLEIDGTGLASTTEVTFTDSAGKSEMVTVSSADAMSVVVTVPTDLKQGTVTVKVCGASFQLQVTPPV